MTAENAIITGDVERRKQPVRRATTRDAPLIARALARSFYADPVVGWFLPDSTQRLRKAERLFDSIYLRRVCLPRNETYTTADVVGGALWLPPDNWQLGVLDNLKLLPHMAAIWGRDLPRAMRGLGYMDKKHPHEPHYYLFILGVEPGWQGRGIGTSLMRPVLDRCDREKLPCYLEATTPRNRDLYRRNGFEVVEETEFPGGPPFWRMWREPRT